jgi:Neuraminidase (sialidase)
MAKDDKNSAQETEKEEDSPSEEQTIFSDLTKKSCQFTSASTFKQMESNALQISLNVDGQRLQILGSGGSGQAVWA